MCTHKTPWGFWLILALWIGDVGATEKPLLTLTEGPNVVFLSVVNNRELPLDQLRVEIEKEKLPAGVKVENPYQPMDVAGGSKSLARFRLSIQIEDDLETNRFDLPLVLHDAADQRWPFHAQVNVRKALPGSFRLAQNHPNPFNPKTVIRYTLAGDRLISTRLEIFNSLGQRVRTLVEATQSAGVYAVEWDGRDDQGQKVSSGVYLYRLMAGDFTKTRTMLLVE